MKTISRYIMTLALLLTAVTGAWADETPLVTIYASKDFKSGSKTFDNKVTATFNQEVAYIADNGWCAVTAGDKTLTFEPVDGVTITRVKYYTPLGNAEVTTAPFEAIMNFTWLYDVVGNRQARYHVSVNGSRIGAEDTNNYLQKIEVYGSAEPPIEVAWDPATKTGNFTQPGSDVVLTPLYAPTAAWAEVETVKQLPAAAEGVIAGTDDPLIVEGIVAFAGTSTEVTQGTVMYAVTPASVTDASELIPSDWKNTVPTAKTVADDGATVKVWYYIQGADTPDGETPTADNTFNDSEVSSLTVTVRSNKFDLALKAANANTVEAGMATVTVGGTAATVTDGKIKGVKMGSEVKLNTKQGYKFRKVEVKKGAAAAAALAPALENGATVVIICNWGYATTTFTYTNNGGTFSGQASGYEAEYFHNGLELNGKNLSFSASNMDNSEYLSVGITFNTESSAYSYTGKGQDFVSFTISVNGTDITSQLTAVK